MKQNFTDRLFCLFRRSKTICVRLRGCLPRSGASLPYRPGIRFVCIICMLPSYPCMRVRARRARQDAGAGDGAVQDLSEAITSCTIKTSQINCVRMG